MGDHGIDLVGRECAGLLERHGAAGVVEERGGIGPEAADRLERLGRAQRALAAYKRSFIAALALSAMAFGALAGIDFLALHGRSATLRQSRSVGRYRNVPGFD